MHLEAAAHSRGGGVIYLAMGSRSLFLAAAFGVRTQGALSGKNFRKLSPSALPSIWSSSSSDDRESEARARRSAGRRERGWWSWCAARARGASSRRRQRAPACTRRRPPAALHSLSRLQLHTARTGLRDARSQVYSPLRRSSRRGRS